MSSSERRNDGNRRRTDGQVRFPFLDRSGEIILWDRRRSHGRRRSDVLWSWSREDVPGFIIMLLMLALLTMGSVRVWFDVRGQAPSLSSVFGEKDANVTGAGRPD